MKIGVFDSGRGGTTVLAAIQRRLPNEEYRYIADSKNCPYGEKSTAELEQITSNLVEELRDWGAQIIVVACNTATTKCISYLRQRYPELRFVGTEPAIKLAACSDAREILVMATPGTLAAERTQVLLKTYQRAEQRIRLLACPGLADTIEANWDEQSLAPIQLKLQELFRELIAEKYSPELIVLGCTHYSLIKEQIQSYFPAAKLIDGNEGVAKRVEHLIEAESVARSA